MTSLIWLLAALPASSAMPDYDAFLESPAGPAVGPVYSAAARDRLEAGWPSNLEPRLGVPTFYWAPRVAREATVLREAGLTAEQAARRWLFLYGGSTGRTAPRSPPSRCSGARPRHRRGDRPLREAVFGAVTRHPQRGDDPGAGWWRSPGYLAPRARGLQARRAHRGNLALRTPPASGSSRHRCTRSPSAPWAAGPTSHSGPLRGRPGPPLGALPPARPARPAWQLETTVTPRRRQTDGYSYVFSAENGRLLLRKDLTTRQLPGLGRAGDSLHPFDGPQGTGATPPGSSTATRRRGWPAW